MAVTRPQDDTGLTAYLQQQKIAVVSVPVDMQGTPHAAAVNFYHQPDQFVFYFVTSYDSQKCSMLREHDEVAAAMVVGTYDHADYTLQMRGTARLVEHEALPDVVAAYHAKRGNTNEGLGRPGIVMVCFVPSWARYVDYANHRPPVQLAV